MRGVYHGKLVISYAHAARCSQIQDVLHTDGKEYVKCCTCDCLLHSRRLLSESSRLMARVAHDVNASLQHLHCGAFMSAPAAESQL